jgi:GTP-binding protein Era
MKSGYVGLIGRPNVGKSTLLNHLIGQKISITARRPQTTRHRILGIKTTARGQAIYVDTPGLHASEPRALNRYLNRTARSVLAGVDVVVWMIDRPYWQRDDDLLFETIRNVEAPVILAINKIDRQAEKSALLPFLQAASERFPFAEIIPVSALRDINLDRLEASIWDRLPEGEPVYPEDQITDRPLRFLAAELIREKLTRCLDQELPHVLTVEIEQFREEPTITRISAVIWVEREGQKVIIIGSKGEGLKKVGQQARLELEKLLGQKVYLNLWVKVKKGWSDNERALQGLGYHDD